MALSILSSPSMRAMPSEKVVVSSVVVLQPPAQISIITNRKQNHSP
jgi:hypothetical protein